MMPVNRRGRSLAFFPANKKSNKERSLFMSNKVNAILENILERFENGDIPRAVSYSVFPISSIPSAQWSFLNRLIMCLSGTADARGIRQWNSVGRTVKRGSKAIYILVPRMIKTTTDNNGSEKTGKNDNDSNKTNDGDDDNNKGKNIEDRLRLKGFLAKPVFRMEDTEGDPLEYTDAALPNLPLLEKARQWGISVAAVPSDYHAYGSYAPNKKEILLATPEEIVFFHELSHAAYERAVERLKPGQVWNQEITAELCAQALTQLVGKKPSTHLGNSYRYIKHYARSAGLSPLSACLSVLDSVEKVLSLILKNEETAIMEVEPEMIPTGKANTVTVTAVQGGI